jgi:hypothetical protein
MFFIIFITIFTQLINSQTICKGTYYFHIDNVPSGCPSVQNFMDGNAYGPCNNGQGVKYGSQSTYWAAIKNGGAYCGEMITVKYNGKSLDLVIQDSCPGCEITNGVDMSLDALIELTGSSEEACAINTIPPVISWTFKDKKQITNQFGSTSSPVIGSSPNTNSNSDTNTISNPNNFPNSDSNNSSNLANSNSNFPNSNSSNSNNFPNSNSSNFNFKNWYILIIVSLINY